MRNPCFATLPSLSLLWVLRSFPSWCITSAAFHCIPRVSCATVDCWQQLQPCLDRDLVQSVNNTVMSAEELSSSTARHFSLNTTGCGTIKSVAPWFIARHFSNSVPIEGLEEIPFFFLKKKINLNMYIQLFLLETDSFWKLCSHWHHRECNKHCTWAEGLSSFLSC